MRIFRDLLGTVMVGDGVLTALIPRRRMRRWQFGPSGWRSLVAVFAERPALTRILGVATAAAGAAIALPRSRG